MVNSVENCIRKYFEPLKDVKLDGVVLGCTHYPILYDIFDDLLNHEVSLIDPGKCTARYVKDVLTEQGMLSDRKELGNTDYNVTDQVSGFEQTASLFLGEPVIGSLNRVELV